MQKDKNAKKEAHEVTEKEIVALDEENDYLKKQLEIDTKLAEKLNELESKNMKLKDVLYGCCECGLYSYECDASVIEDITCSILTTIISTNYIIFQSFITTLPFTKQ